MQRICSRATGLSTLMAIVVGAVTATASAGIIGFGNFVNDWEYNQAPTDTDTPADFPDSNTIHITNSALPGTSQNRSIFFKSRQDSAQFIANFTFRGNIGSSLSQGLSFILQNDPDGYDSLGGLLGYAGLANSFATTLDVRNNTIGFSQSGAVASGIQVEGIDLSSDNDIDITIIYDGNFLTQRLVDTVTGVEFSRNNIIVGDLSSDLGDNKAYVGFGSSSFRSDQFISNFRFTSTIPTPGSASVLAAGLFAIARRRRR